MANNSKVLNQTPRSWFFVLTQSAIREAIRLYFNPLTSSWRAIQTFLDQIPTEALRLVRRSTNQVSPDDSQSAEVSSSGQLAKRQEQMEAKIDLQVVAKGNWNPFSVESRLARQAEEEAFKARLTIFRDNVEVVRKANKVLNNAAIIEIVTAAETFITEIRSIAEVTKQRILDDARLRLLAELHSSLAELETHSGHLPNELIEAMWNTLCHEFAKRVHKLASLDFEFDKQAVPFITKKQVKGVLEIFHRTPLASDPEWLNFLEALVSQVAIAIDNIELLNELRRSNTELAQALDATIEGWSRALDLRHRASEGHTQRVTEITLHLARAIGIGTSEDALVHMRWGALLHDIGKMSIPDSILLKPGPLTNEEWSIIRRHPGYAYEILSPITYLRPALDIPYHHHEKWDGTGYPTGLKGEAIPLAARIFAVADAWDALRSDRPYRVSWPSERVRKYIQSLSGKHFDPQVVEMFLKMEQ